MEIDQALKKCKLPQLTQFEIDNLDNSITNREIELIILKFPMTKYSISVGFWGELY